MQCSGLETVIIEEDITIPQTLRKVGTRVFSNVLGPVNYYSNNQTMINYAKTYADETIYNTLEAKTLIGIEIKSQPTKVEYVEGEDFDKTGMKITAVYEDGTKKETSNYTVVNRKKLTCLLKNLKSNIIKIQKLRQS